MILKIDNRPHRHRGRNITISVILGIVIVITGLYYFGNYQQPISSLSDVVKSNVNQIGKSVVSNLTKLTSSSPPTPIDYHSIALQTHQLVNRERALNNVPPLTWNEQIAQEAIKYSQYMSAHNNYGHFDLAGHGPDYRLTQAGLNCRNIWAENLEWMDGYGSTQIANLTVNDWMSDEGHKNNLLNPNLDSEGIGIFVNGTQTYVTEDFC